MRLWFALSVRFWLAIGLGLFLLALLASCDDTRVVAEAPPGSRIVGALDVCFVHWTPEGWKRIGLVDEHGRPAVTGIAFKGRWFFPLDAGPVAIEACK